MNSTKHIFLKQFESFLEEIKKLSGNNKDILLLEEQYSMIKSINSKLIIEYFIKYVYPYNKKIKDRDDEFFLNGGGQEDLDKMFIHLRDGLADLWKTKIDVSKKNIVWKYMHVLCLLCEKYIQENNLSIN